MLIVNHIYGHCDDPFWSPICEDMEARGCLELLPICRHTKGSAQFRSVTDKGTVAGVLLDAAAPLRPGSVLFYEEGRRVVLAELRDARTLAIASLNDFTMEDALLLGQYLGGLGWQFQVRQQVTHIEIFVPYTGPVSNSEAPARPLGALTAEEAAMDALLRTAPVQNISWTFRDRQATDPVQDMTR